MNKTVLLLILVSIFSAFTATSQTVDIQKSEIKWIGKKVGGEHSGKVALKSASIVVAADKITSGTFIIDMNSISCTDLTDAEYNAKLVGHLKSEDFFGVQKYPEAKLVVTSSTPFKNGKAQITGSLTIKSTTETITFSVQRTSGGYFANIIIDRSKFDIRYGSSSFFDSLGDNVIYDEFTLEVKLVTK